MVIILTYDGKMEPIMKLTSILPMLLRNTDGTILSIKFYLII